MFDKDTKSILIECLNKNIRRELYEAATVGATGATGAPSNALQQTSTSQPSTPGDGTQTGFSAPEGEMKAQKGSPLDPSIAFGDPATLAMALAMGGAGAAVGSVTGLGQSFANIGGNIASKMAPGLGIFSKLAGDATGQLAQKLQKGFSDISGGERALSMIGDIPTTSSNILVGNLGYTPAGSWAQQKLNMPKKPEPILSPEERRKKAEDEANIELDRKIADAKRQASARKYGITP